MKNARVVVLGGSAGIGLAVARAAASEGAQVTVVGSTQQRIREATSEGLEGAVVDLRSADAVQRFFAGLPQLDHLVFTAGEELLLSPLAQLDLKAARRFYELRYWGALTAVQAAAPRLSRQGSIVLTGGSAGHRAPPGFVIGAGLCGAMESTTRALAVELAPVRVNIVVPGFVDTGLWSSVPEASRRAMFDDAAAKLPVRHVGAPEELALHYLAFMKGTYVTGQALIVDGGGLVS